MSNEPVIQVRYNDLQAIVGRLGKQRDVGETLAREINTRYMPLREGSFQGEMARTFCAEMEDLIFPAMAKLVALLGDMQAVTDEVARLFRTAEEEASRFSQNGKATDDSGESGGALRGNFLGIPYSFSFYNGQRSTDKGSEKYFRGDFMGIPFSFKQRAWTEDPGSSGWKWEGDGKYTKSEGTLGLKYGHLEGVYKQLNTETEFQLGPLKISDGLSAKLGAGDVGLGARFAKENPFVGFQGEADSVKIEQERLIQLGDFGMTFKGIVRGPGGDAEAGFDWKEKRLGFGAEVRAVSVEGQFGLNIGGNNYYMLGEVGPKAGIGWQWHKGLKAKAPFVSMGGGFGDAVDGKVDD